MFLRELRENETELLQTFLYEAIFIPEGVEPPDRSIIMKISDRAEQITALLRMTTAK